MFNLKSIYFYFLAIQISLIKFIKKDQSDIYLVQELKCTNDAFPEVELNNINYKWCNCWNNAKPYPLVPFKTFINPWTLYTIPPNNITN